MSDVLCACCALFCVNGDQSACRDYYSHTHPDYSGPYRAVGEAFTCYTEVECAGCGDTQLPGAVCYWAEVADDPWE